MTPSGSFTAVHGVLLGDESVTDANCPLCGSAEIRSHVEFYATAVEHICPACLCYWETGKRRADAAAWIEKTCSCGKIFRTTGRRKTCGALECQRRLKRADHSPLITECERCHKAMKVDYPGRRYHDECARIVRAEKARDYSAKHYEKVRRARNGVNGR